MGGRCLKPRGVLNPQIPVLADTSGGRCLKYWKTTKMKNRIRQILREETSGFDPKMLNALYQYMNFITKDYVWYHDTPEQRFKYTPGSIWLINPETKEWVVELEKRGRMWWDWDFYLNFQRYFNMEQSDFERFIKIWVEDVLNRGVSSTNSGRALIYAVVEDVLKNGEELK
jgi:hypothetical protein